MDFRGHRNLKANKRTWLITKSCMGVDYLLQLASQAVKLVPFSWPGLARRYKSGQEPGELAAASPLPVPRVKWHQRQTYFFGEITRPLASSHSFPGTVIYCVPSKNRFFCKEIRKSSLAACLSSPGAELVSAGRHASLVHQKKNLFFSEV